MTEPTAPPPARDRGAAQPLWLLLAATAAVFARGIAGGWVYDDQALIATRLATVDLGRALAEPLWAHDHHWRPLTALLLWTLAPLGAPAVHAAALLLHAAAAACAFAIARRLLGGGAPALAAALLFALHPVHAEAVGWATALNDPLWGLCALLAVWWWLRGRAPVAGVTVLFALGLLAKETALVIPLLVAGVAAVAPAPAGTTPARPVRRLLLWALVPLAAWLVARALVFGAPGLGLAGIAGEGTLLRRATLPPEVAGRLLPSWLGVAPAAMFRPLAALAPDGRTALGCALFAAAVAAAAWAWRRGGTAVRVALLLSAVPLLPVVAAPAAAGAYPIADRYLYASALGLALLVASGLRRAPWLAVLLAAAFGARTVLALGAFADQRAFVAAQRERAPDDVRLRYMQARLWFDDASQTPSDPTPLHQAIALLDEAPRLLAAAPPFGGSSARERLAADVQLLLGWCEFSLEARSPRPDWQRPLRRFRTVAERHPDFALAHNAVGVCLGQLGDVPAARRAFERALQLDPDLAEARANLERTR